jgi:hypothetical protein
LDRHRYSTDDLVTSWYACQHTQLYGYNNEDSLNVLDMGCGLGSVLLSNAWQLPNSKLHLQPRYSIVLYILKGESW